MELDVSNLVLIAFSTFISVTAFKFGWNDAFGLIIGIFFLMPAYVSIFAEPWTAFAAILGASPYIAYYGFELTPAGRHRRTKIDLREAKERKAETERAQRMQRQRVAREAAVARQEEAARQSRLAEIARQNVQRLNESIERIHLRTSTEEMFMEGPTPERHRSLRSARRALEGGLFFGQENFSVKERIYLKKSGKPQFGLLPPSGHEAWLTEIRLWTAYAQRDLQFLSDSLQQTHSKCSRCGRLVSVSNKLEAMSQLAKELKLPDSLYWRQAVLNAQWRTLKWQLEPADLLPPPNALDLPRLPLSAAALKFIFLEGEDNDRLGDENSPFPYFHIAKSHSDQRFRNFWDGEKRHSDDAWEVAKILASISVRVDDCLECVGSSEKFRRARVKLSPRQREAVMMRDAFRCQNCGRNAREDQVKLHIDHIVPWSKGGTDDMENLRTLCDECNLGKSDQEIV